MKFLVTEESGRLARWLRLMGYDVALAGRIPLSNLYRQACNEGRTVLTRNHRVKAGSLVRVVHVESGLLEEQLRQLIRDAGVVVDEDDIFTRCDRCNVPVEPIEKAQAKARVPPYVYHTQEEFHQCPSCRRIYWAATHWERACKLFERVKAEGSHA